MKRATIKNSEICKRQGVLEIGAEPPHKPALLKVVK